MLLRNLQDDFVCKPSSPPIITTIIIIMVISLPYLVLDMKNLDASKLKRFECILKFNSKYRNFNDNDENSKNEIAREKAGK